MLRGMQLVTRVSDALVEAVDGLVRDGIAPSRSAAVRLGLERLVDDHRRRRTDEAIVSAYRRQPQTEEELRGLDEATRALVEEEPW